MNMTTQCAPESLSLTIVCDERCTVVRSLAALLRVWDHGRRFTFVDRESPSPIAAKLMSELDNSRWSLFLIDEQNERWHGPDAIPMILQNLPFGKFAAVFYILPGTMWLTRYFYMVISNLRFFLSGKRAPA